MKRTGLFIVILLCTLYGCRHSKAEYNKERPNIVLIMSDDMGYSDIGAYGGEVNTPNLDQLAAQGLKFTQFYNMARCCPTRASLMTGLYPHQTGIGHMTNTPNDFELHDHDIAEYRGFLNNTSVTLAEVLKAAGYSTLMTGKWHLGIRDKRKWPLQRGFDKFYGILPGAGQVSAQKKDRPNVLIIIGDDCTYSDLPAYGGLNVKTPAIDQLVSEGLTFDKAYVTMSMCAPSRSELFTGLQPANNGVCWNHARARPGVESIVQYLAKEGYRTGIAGKRHIRPRTTFPFEVVPGVEGNAVAETASFDPAGIQEFIARDEKQPFCLVTALTSPHVPWTVGDPSHFNEDSLKLPPNMVGTKDTRKAFAKYLAEIEVLDEQVGRTLQLLKDAGVYDNTMVIFISEQGAQFPYSKWTNYDNGVHTGFIIRWSGVTKPGERTDALIQYCDVLPTILDAVGGNSSGFDGTSFLPVLKGEKSNHREYVYFMHNNFPEGPPYPIRSITDGEFHYILNLNSQNMYIEKHLMGRPNHSGYWLSWMLNITESDQNFDIVTNYMLRPEEELFIPEEDPYEQNNLAGMAAYNDLQASLAQELKAWMKAQGDPGASIDSKEEFNAQNKGNHFKQNN